MDEKQLMLVAKTNLDTKVLADVVHDELAGTGLQFAVIVWRAGFLQRGDDVAYGTRTKDESEMADAMMKAVDQITGAMKKKREG